MTRNLIGLPQKEASMTEMPMTFVLWGLGLGVEETFFDKVFNGVILDHMKTALLPEVKPQRLLKRRNHSHVYKIIWLQHIPQTCSWKR